MLCSLGEMRSNFSPEEQLYRRDAFDAGGDIPHFVHNAKEQHGVGMDAVAGVVFMNSHKENGQCVLLARVALLTYLS